MASRKRKVKKVYRGHCIICGVVKKDNIKLHAVPFTKKNWQVWLRLCPKLQKYTTRRLESVKLCESHFIPEHINEKKRLTNDALPLLNLGINKPPILSLSPLDTPDVVNDHTYSKPLSSKPSNIVPFVPPTRITTKESPILQDNLKSVKYEPFLRSPLNLLKNISSEQNQLNNSQPKDYECIVKGCQNKWYCRCRNFESDCSEKIRVCSVHFNKYDYKDNLLIDSICLKTTAIPNSKDSEQYMTNKNKNSNVQSGNITSSNNKDGNIKIIAPPTEQTDECSATSTVELGEDQLNQSEENLEDILSEDPQKFGEFVANELRSMHYERNMRELKRLIQQHIVRWTEIDDNEFYVT